MSLDESASEGGAEVIDDRYDQIDGNDQGEEAVLQKEADGDLDLLAEPAGADVTQDDRLSDVDLPPVEGVGNKLRQDLGEDAVKQDLKPGGAGRLKRLDRLGFDVLHHLPEEPSQDFVTLRRDWVVGLEQVSGKTVDKSAIAQIGSVHQSSFETSVFQV